MTLIEIVSGDEHASAQDSLSRVAGWLASHGVKARSEVVAASMANASQLSSIAKYANADLIVAGAYGHNRQGRWALGGITSELLEGERCALLSH